MHIANMYTSPRIIPACSYNKPENQRTIRARMGRECASPRRKGSIIDKDCPFQKYIPARSWKIQTHIDTEAGGRGGGDYPVGRYRRAAAETGTRFTRVCELAQRSHPDFFFMFFFSRSIENFFNANARDKVDGAYRTGQSSVSSITNYGAATHVAHITSDIICRGTFTVSYSHQRLATFAS